MIKKKDNEKGFSLIEVLVTLMILSIGITAISALMAGNIRTSVNAKNQIIASSLAQEGVEMVRYHKENNPTFTSEILDGDDYSIDFTVPYFQFKDSDIEDDSQKKMKLSPSNIYYHSNGKATKFLRKIRIATVGGNQQIESLVSWNGTDFPSTCNVGNKCVSIISVLPDAN